MSSSPPTPQRALENRKRGVVIDLCSSDSSENDDEKPSLDQQLDQYRKRQRWEQKEKKENVVQGRSADDDAVEDFSQHPGALVLQQQERMLKEYERQQKSRRLVDEEKKKDCNESQCQQKPAATRSGSSMVFLEGQDDGCRLTNGVVEALIRAVSDKPNIRTCYHGSGASVPPSTVPHIQQLDKWSCGFRNTQMLLSALLPQRLLMSNSNAASSRTVPIPTLRTLQATLERLWSAGWDAEGARHYGYQLVGKKEWVGAVEIWTMLTAHYRYDCCVVQFIKCWKSRIALGPFCWAYFSKQPDFVCRCSLSSLALAKSLLNSTSPPTTTATADSSCSCTTCRSPWLPPLYMQWKGHSVTIVGCERHGNEYDLLILDPLKPGEKLLRSLKSGAIPDTMRLSCTRLANQQRDMQLLLCANPSKSLSNSELQRCRGRTTTFTAS